MSERTDAIERRWAELSSLFDRAFDLEPAARTEFLAAIADLELREALATLLANSERASSLDLGSGRLATALIELEPGMAEARLGAWRIDRLIGLGGMSSVYAAHRADGAYEQQVAIKVLHHGLGQADDHARFVHERSILARLVHPNIAHLLDGGINAAGLPWFALEFVDGLPVTTHADRQRLDLGARLRLFVHICRTVAYAHRNLVVHGDLKPSNILVRADGTLKLVDFGIARLLAADTAVPAPGSGWATPGYAAPEQETAGAVTTASDVHALGVVLHELLTGQRPQASADGSIPKASGVPVTAAAVTARRSSPVQLHRRLAGDLDLILAGALDPAPARRYPDAASLAAEIESHLADRPLAAAQSPPGQRLGKFLRRHRVGVAVVASLVVALSAGAAATLWQAHAARQEASRATAARDFVLAMFGSITPDETRGRTISARELVDRGVLRLDETLAEHPRLESELSSALAGAYRQLGEYPTATALAGRALDSAGTPAQQAAALLEQGEIAAALGKFDQAEAALGDAIALKTPDTGLFRLRLAKVLSEHGKLEEARSLAEETLAAAGGREPELAVRANETLGIIRFHQGELDAAVALLRDALSRQLGLHGRLHTRSASLAHDLAVILLQKGEATEAAELLEQALATRRTLLGDAHPDTADSELNLGSAQRRLGLADSARSHIEHAVASLEASLGNRHPAVANGLNSLAVSALAEADFTMASARFSEALDAARGAYGETHPTIAAMLNNLAAAQRGAGQHAAAAATAREAVATATSALGPEHYLVGITRLSLGNILLEAGHTDAAIEAVRDANRILEAGLGPEHQDTLLARGSLAFALLRHGESADATQLIGATLAPAATAYPAGHPRLGKLHLLAARIAAETGDCSQASLELEAAAAGLAAAGAPGRTDRAWAELTRWHCLASGEDAEATAAARSATLAALAEMESMPPDLAAAAGELR